MKNAIKTHAIKAIAAAAAFVFAFTALAEARERFSVVGGRLLDRGEFDLGRLLCSNYIDLGVYVHRRSLIDELGSFNENMPRLRPGGSSFATDGCSCFLYCRCRFLPEPRTILSSISDSERCVAHASFVV